MKKINFKTTTIRQIRIWAWLATVVPITALAGIFFVWTLGTDSWFRLALAIGETAMFAIAVIWWWWAMYVMRNLVKHWDETKSDVKGVLNEVSEIKSIVIETLARDK